MCRSCDAVRAARHTGDAEAYYRVLDEVRALMRAGVLRLLCGTCALSAIGPDRPWPSERMSHAFVSRACGAHFGLSVEPFESKGGAWTPLDDAEKGVAADGRMARIEALLAGVDWRTTVVAAAIGSGWWLIVVGILTFVGFPIAAWLTPAALMMVRPMARHYVQSTAGRPPEDRRLGARVLGGLMGGVLGAILGVWAAFFIPLEATPSGIAAIVLIVLIAAGAAGGAVLGDNAASRALQAEPRGASRA